YETYKPLLEEYSINYIAPLRIIKNGEYEDFVKCLNENNFLIKDGNGEGEGIVIKRYDFYNKYGRQTWAKIVTAEFKDRHRKEMGAPVTENKMLEEEIVEEFVTGSFVEKEYAKIVNEKGGWNTKLIPMLLSKVLYELVNEEMWNIIKKFRNPKIDFKTLNTFVICKVKSVMPQIFG
ncbi:MAG: hypothetical protein RRY15_08540, partial [Bacteroidales bacterium]